MVLCNLCYPAQYRLPAGASLRCVSVEPMLDTMPIASDHEWRNRPKASEFYS